MAATISATRRLSTRGRLLLAIGPAWLAVLLISAKALTLYQTTPGAMGPSAPRWPPGSHLTPAVGRSTLVMFAHPYCSCTRASLDELNVVLNQAAGRLHAIVVFARPPGTEPGWEQSSTWGRAQHLPDTTVQVDRDGLEAKRFGALTSGQVALYGADGRLEFFGGMTDSRGHEGNNMGRQAILDRVLGRTTAVNDHPVYGCELL